MSETAGAEGPSWRGHLAIARVDHWFKNVFAIPGLVLALVAQPAAAGIDLVVPTLLGMLALCLVASSNYTLNELVDARFDVSHPRKRNRPVPAGRVSTPWAYAQWVGLMVGGMLLAHAVSWQLSATLAALWIMGGVYNIPPVRTKDIAYLDVLTEAVNNPLRLLAGWFIIDTDAFLPASLLSSYWMIGCYFMGLKRYAEYRAIADPQRAAAYRRSFRHYDANRLLVSVMFYASAAMLCFGAFLMRYRLEMILAFPVVAYVMSSYLALALEEDSPVQRPEELYKAPRLMFAVALCSLVLVLLLVVDIPPLHQWLAPWGAEGSMRGQ